MTESNGPVLLGVHSQLFRGTPAAVARSVVEHDLNCVQLTPNFPDLHFDDPGQFTQERCRRAAEPFQAAGIRIVVLSASTHLLDSDLDRRHRALLRFHAMIRHCREFGTEYLVAETGDLGVENARPRSDSRRSDAWQELRSILKGTLALATDHGITLLLKPGNSHLLATVDDAIRLQDELRHPSLGFVMDPAEFLMEQEPAHWSAELNRLFEHLDARCPVLHVKDLGFDDGRVVTPRVGRGLLDYRYILQTYRRSQKRTTVILEHVRPQEVAVAKSYLEACLLDSISMPQMR
jgi:sugar phosphate isomerase/epimerase